VRLIRKVFLILATLLASSAVSVSGIIGFVGLIIPHWVRLLIGPDHRFLFPFSALLGGIFCIYSDMLARTLLSPTEIPIGIITAAVGAPFFIYLLHKKS
jgi:iron complex transport system permease protein